MSIRQKSILTAGLGVYASNDPNGQAVFGPGPEAGKKAKELIAGSVSKAKELGFDVIACDVNTKDPEDTFRRFAEALKDDSREWVGVNIGFGLRGHKEHTALFEKLVNEAWALRPGIRIMFSDGPDKIITAIERNF